METDTTMLIAGLTSLFAVSLLFLSLFVSGESGGTGKGRTVFKTGKPPLDGKPATQAKVDVPATLEAATRQAVKPS